MSSYNSYPTCGPRTPGNPLIAPGPGSPCYVMKGVLQLWVFLQH